MNKNNIAALFDEWNLTLQTKDPKKVTALYDSNSILLPTVSNKIRHNHEEIENYFTDFLPQEPVGKIDEANIRIFNHIAINSGVYTFTLKDHSTVQARFTFVYRWNGKRWMIIEHHSSPIQQILTQTI
ncbi:MAG: hypothetical protein ACI9D5_000108 [Candidatus Endobugula sp.]|jgi:uncharacterized protein (TIGR02246 family)